MACNIRSRLNLNGKMIHQIYQVFKVQRVYLSTSASFLGSYFPRYRMTPSNAVKWVNTLTQEEKRFIIVALEKEPTAKNEAKSNEHASQDVSPTVIPKPSSSDLYRLAVQQGLPFVGFGFLDNFIMIVAGESIETYLGTTFVISTMAAAALGNTISDVFGIGSAWYVEYLIARLGLGTSTNLTIEQLEQTSARVASNIGRALGVTIGCLLGMFPLLFYKQNEKDDRNIEE